MNHQVTLRNGITVPALGLGTWYLGENAATYAQEKKALSAGIDAGMTLLDTAEMYGGGAAEDLLGDVIRKYDREKLYIVSKVLPGNANRRHLNDALRDSMDRLGVDYLDLYLYHWRGGTPLAETVACLEEAKAAGKIRAWGVSNFDISDMEELWQVPGGKNCLVNQVLYHVGSRGIEYSLLPWMREHNVALMAYCPLAQAGSLRRGLMTNPALKAVAERHQATVAQVMLAFAIRDGHTIAIPRSAHAGHTLENAGADAITLTPEDLAQIEAAYPAPTRKEWLDMQ